MKNSLNFERRVLESIAKLMRQDTDGMRRWYLFGRVLSIVGWALVFFTLISCLGKEVVPRVLLLLSMVGGGSAALGIWFSSFSMQ